MNSKLVRVLQKTKIFFEDVLTRMAYISRHRLISRLSSLPDFPNSKCKQSQYIELTLEGAQKTYREISKLCNHKIYEPVFYKAAEELQDVRLAASRDFLANRFDYYGSDKASRHAYHFLYATLMSRLSGRFNSIFEIGIGSNSSKIPSNMGLRGKPGASLRAWKSINKDVEVVGADIDTSILFNESQIETLYLDQTDDYSWLYLIEKLQSRKFDLIIDDGLHTPMAGIKTLQFASTLLNPGGFIVIEDVSEKSLEAWNLVLNYLSDDWVIELYSFEQSICLVLSRKI